MSARSERREADVIVVGAGVAGLATAWAVAGRGRSVCLLEQFTVGHRFGSSHGDARIFKLSYPDEEFVRLAQSSLVEWRQLEDACGEEILSLLGSLDVGGIAGRREALDACGVAYEFVDAATIETRFGLAVREMPSRSFNQTAVSCTPIEREQLSCRLQGKTVSCSSRTRGLTGSPSTPSRYSSRRRQVLSGQAPWWSRRAPGSIGSSVESG